MGKDLLKPPYPQKLKCFAIAARSCYTWSEKHDSGIDEINKLFRSCGHFYKIVPSECTDEMMLFYNQMVNSYIIGFKGTHPGNKSLKTDLLADLNIALRTGAFNEKFQKRVQFCEGLIKKIKDKSNGAKIYTASHSLGGSTNHYAMYSSQYIFENVNKAYLYNPGATPLQITKLAKYAFTNKNVKWKEKIMIEHIKGDNISRLSNLLEGDFRSYLLNEGWFRWFASYGIWLINPLLAALINVGKTVKYHNIDNFIL